MLVPAFKPAWASFCLNKTEELIAMSTTPNFQTLITSGGTLLLPSKMDVTIKSSTILNSQSATGGSVYDAWCLAHDVTILTPFTYTTYLYSSYELGTLQPAMPSLGAAYLANLDNINWLLNWYNGSNATSGDVQGAIWKMMGNTYIDSNAGPQNENNINALVSQAMAHDGYVPEIGDKIAAVFDTTVTTSSGKVVHYQPLIVSLQAASLGDTVWHDANANGIQDAGETGIAGATVTLVRDIDGDKKFTGPNEVLATTTTDSAGHYVFKGLTPGLDYQVVFSLPSNYDSVSPRQAGGASLSGVNSDALVSDVVVLANGENNKTLDAGFYNKASLGDRVWVDANGNGQQDDGEVGVAGAKVTLVGGGADGLISTAADNTSVTTTTDANGNYKFTGLTPGVEYQVQFAAPDGSVFTAQDKGADVSDSDANSSGLSQIVKLASGENNTTIDAGVYVPASLGDRVWVDANGNGQQDDGETGVAGAKVTLIGGGADGLISTTADNTTVTTTTDANGNYKFTGLTPGVEYQVQFAAPEGSVFTAQDKGNDASDSDANSSGLSQIVKLASGENNTTIDAGVYVPASLGDRVWVDANGNGQQDDGETGVAGAKVTLIGGGADGLISTTADNTAVTTTTDANGNYKFTGLTPGVEYQVQFAAPEGSVFTAQDKGADVSDSDANSSGLSQIVKLASGENNTTIDAGVYVPASLGDRVWVDANGNGQQDDGETGVAGAKVTLIGGGADGLISTTADNTTVTTTTDANGNYKFTGLTPGVEYQVQFAAPEGSVFTAQDKGADVSDSDANSSGLSQIVKLASGENNMTIDAGVYVPASLGDRVWVDANGNGQQDDGETGVAGAKVTLIGGGADGLISTTADNTTVTTTTDANGNYKFTGLTPGVEYQVQFAAPDGSVFTAQDKGADASDSDANSAGLSQIVKLASGENNTTIDAGVYVPASLGDRVWVDANGNGQQDDGEIGVAGAKVTLIGGGADGLISTTADNTTVTTTTDANGNYKFTGLTPGVEYQVQFAAQDGAVFTAQDKGNDASDSDANSNGLSQIVKLTSGENNTTIDAGVYVPASLGDRVWVDVNGNGQQDANEVGVAGAKVTLIGGGADGLISTTADNTTVTTTTDVNGNYKFTGLTPGVEYQVQFAAPEGNVFTAQDKGDDISDSDADATTGKSQIVKLVSGENNTTIDAGVYVPASLGDRVWTDANGNGQQDANEVGVAGAKVTLIGGGADGLISTTADNTTVTTTTDANGNYKFTGLTPGVEYQVQFAAPDGSMFTAQDKGNDVSDSDANSSGLSQIVKLVSGENNTTIDAGVYVPASLGDRVWVDANGNGQQDANEVGVAGAKVTLIGGGADGLISTTADNTTVTTTTDANGNYKFTGLIPGVEYQVQFAAPEGSVFTAQDKGADASDSDANSSGLSQIVKLISGENNTTIDAGVYTPASLGDRVWTDSNGNGQQDANEVGVAGAKVTLIGGGADGLISTTADNTTVTTTTDANGNYKFTGLTPGVEYQVQFTAQDGTVFTAQDKGNDATDSDADATTGKSQIVKLASGENNTSIDAGVYTPATLGDRVWTDANGNGQQDANEVGVSGAKVTLIGGGADGLISTTADNTSVTTTTDASGNYKFTGLTPGMEYQVQFSAPTGTVFTTQDKGSDASDSDADAATGKSQIVKLASGENNTTIDAGVYTPASIGDRFWIDANGNGQQDANEAGVAGATITLIGGGADGLISTTADNTTATTTTDANGAYLFNNLKPGMEYQVQFSAPTGMVFTKRDVGSDASDSDADTTTGKTQIVTLASGEKNMSLDAGVYKPAMIGDRVWNDANSNGVQDSGETGIAGVTITLLGGGADGKLSTTGDNTSITTTTDANGYYQFTNLNPGTEYQVQYTKPTGYVSTGSNSGGGASTSTGQTGVVVLESGESNKSLDIGLAKLSGDLSITKTDGVTTVTPGQTITYTIVAKNAGTATATNAVVTDSLPTYLSNVSWTSTASSGASGNQASGTGSINNTLTLAGGASVTYTVKATVASMASLEKVADFGSMTNNSNLGQNTTISGVHVDAAYITSTGQIGNAVLWARNSGTDKGLGVWSPNEASPTTTGSVTGELSNGTNSEVIRLTLEEGRQWSSLWVSSLDKNSAGGAEMGTLYWSDSATPDLSTLTTKFVFKNGDFGVGAEEGDLLSLRPAGFDTDAKYLFFVAGGNGSTAKSDYLVWKAGTIPTTIANTAAIAAPNGFTDTNTANNSATDIDKLAVPTPAAAVRGSIGDLVWEDMNFNGVRDSGEAGIANVTVRLLDANNNVLATTVTNSSGNYLFNNLNAGNYKIEVVEPSGYYATKANIGSNDAVDSDVDTTYGRSGLISLSQGENDLTWDAGLYRKASIGDKVWRDSDHDDIQDAGEEGIGGVKVMLYSASGTLMGTTTTNSNGNYKFANLDPGSYYLVFDKTNVMFQGTGMSTAVNMNIWKWASKDIGTNDAIDSDVAGDGVATTNVTRTDVTTLKSGENDMSWDAAITPIAIDLNGDGVHTVARGASTATFDLLGNGSAIASGWLSSSDGFLAVDLNGNGKIDGIGELFGGSAKGDGFAKLASYDSNGDGVVDAHDAAFASLVIWRDANGNHATDSGELMSLAQAGVTSLKVAHTDLPFVDAQGNLHLERSSVTMANGTVADMTDVYFAIDAKDAPNAATFADLIGGNEPVIHVQVGLVGQAPVLAA